MVDNEGAATKLHATLSRRWAGGAALVRWADPWPEPLSGRGSALPSQVPCVTLSGNGGTLAGMIVDDMTYHYQGKATP